LRAQVFPAARANFLQQVALLCDRRSLLRELLTASCGTSCSTVRSSSLHERLEQRNANHAMSDLAVANELRRFLDTASNSVTTQSHNNADKKQNAPTPRQKLIIRSRHADKRHHNRPVSYRLELELIKHIESFNTRLRDECQNVDQFVTLDDAREQFEAWRHHYNRNRPHSLEPDPHEFARQGQAVRNDEGGDFSLGTVSIRGQAQYVRRDRRRDAKTSRRLPESASNLLIGRHSCWRSADPPIPNRSTTWDTSRAAR
jgi:hypothetical protein